MLIEEQHIMSVQKEVLDLNRPGKVHPGKVREYIF